MALLGSIRKNKNQFHLSQKCISLVSGLGVFFFRRGWGGNDAKYRTCFEEHDFFEYKHLLELIMLAYHSRESIQSNLFG